ncbi:alpha-2-macroglobulin family protein [Pseudooceanicola sp. 216_PA32_1]|uniref:Alpha-2-macroglobulin family protein n=1 Tax=Pseudooceanicola pacificus TaxID=2676438 RepID=A0A844W736_9RHOB|nr:alpha-2-macroglobulin family protein [Pseudooceanicola pacificus]MWB76523.1 alpha-2-macroglobulin family protein [Pseudooceanicola pacificus]
MHRILSTAIALVLTALPGLAQTAADQPLPQKRMVVTMNTDFPGSDLQSLFDTTFEACRSACTALEACTAFTYNAKSRACFPKSTVSERIPFDGAHSAEMFTMPPAVTALAGARVADLGFAGDSTLRKARDLAEQIGWIHPSGQYDLQTMLQASRNARASGDILNAMRWMGGAVARSDSPDQWAEFGRLLLEVQTGNTQDRRRYRERAMLAAINGYLRAEAVATRVNTLTVLAVAFEQNDRGRDMIPALRLAERLQPREDTTAALENAIAKYGFRITEHRVDSDQARPRICAEFTEPLAETGVNYADFVRLPDQSMAVEADGNQICIAGGTHGERYTVTFREGMPARSGETLAKDVELRFYIRDRSPMVRFPGRAYVLPASGEAALPIETVNLDSVDLKLRRVVDRNLLRAIQNSYFARPIYEYEDGDFASDVAEEVWRGTGAVQNEINAEMTTRLPLGEVLSGLTPGAYALTATIPGADPYENQPATQWFILTDLGMTTLSGTDGLHVFVRGLGDAAAMPGVEVALLSRANRVLGTATTDARGYASFAEGLTLGKGGAEPALVTARSGTDDLAFLSLTDPAFDLSDRGVEGREPAPPIDVFLATDRGAYRAGEVIHATALARDGVAHAIDGLPLTAILTRPDGVEYARLTSTDAVAGGHVFAMPVASTAPRGTWRIDIKADLDAAPLRSTEVLVEDFLPERIDFEMTLPDGPITLNDTPPMAIEAKYLFGAPAGGLKVEGEVTLTAKPSLPDFPRYRFGRHDTTFYPRTEGFGTVETSDQGRAIVDLALPQPEDTPDTPLEARITTRVLEGSGRPVERRMTRLLAPLTPVIGIRPEFDDVVPESSDAAFSLIALGPQMTPVPMPVTWTVNRVRTEYQWYQQYGNWQWEPFTTRTEVATGTATLGADPVQISAPVEWGEYEVIVERADGAPIGASMDFYAGWYAPADTTTTPDTLDLSLDKPAYAIGETAQLRLVPRYAGTALVTVMSNRLIDMKAVEVREGDNLIELPVSDDWGAGAYVTASVIRPMDIAAGHNPARSMGLSYAKVDPGEKALAVSFDAPAESDPRGPLSAAVRVEGIAEGETAWVTVAAVDVGILNLTSFKTPDPQDHYFGQRRLGMDIRDLYGRLIDGMNGAMGQVRSGGDGSNRMAMDSPPPTEELVAYFTGPVQVGPDGTATVTFDMPEFNGTVRLAALAWSPTGVGSAQADVLVRDPVVVTATLPRFLQPGDSSTLMLEIVHASGPVGRAGLDVTATGVALGAGAPSGIDLTEQGKQVVRLPITASGVGDHAIRVALTTPDGKQLTKTLTVPVRANDPEVSTTQRFSLAAGDTFTLDGNVFAGLMPGTGQAIVSAGPLARLDAPALLATLNRYPYGCTEQVTSKAMPLLYLSSVAEAMGLGQQSTIRLRVDQAIDRILTRQASNGAFGLWRASSGDFWLDAYVSDFLSRARAEGYAVPDIAFRTAMDNLRNRINYAPDFDASTNGGGEDLAYALMVLAREGAASMGDLRYYADVKGEDFATPLAAAQLGAALAAYGDQTRADAMFAIAARKLAQKDAAAEAQVYRTDYGTNLRDAAGLLSLAVEAGSNAVDTATLASRIGAVDGPMSTQESAWSLLAAKALVDDPTVAGLSLNGALVDGPFVRAMEAEAAAGMAIRNEGTSQTDITLTTIGIPTDPVAAGGYGYTIERTYYTMQGDPVSPATVKAGDRMVAVLTVTPFEATGARLMVNDPLPAGFEIDNPNILRSGDIKGLDWLKTTEAETTEFRSDRFLAAVDWRSANAFDLAYIVRAISPGEYHHPAAVVEDMYRPRYRARTDAGRVTVTP